MPQRRGGLFVSVLPAAAFAQTIFFYAYPGGNPGHSNSPGAFGEQVTSIWLPLTHTVITVELRFTVPALPLVQLLAGGVLATRTGARWTIPVVRSRAPLIVPPRWC